MSRRSSPSDARQRAWQEWRDDLAHELGTQTPLAFVPVDTLAAAHGRIAARALAARRSGAYDRAARLEAFVTVVEAEIRLRAVVVPARSPLVRVA